ncbi:pentapeptide repeat-containing protein [Bacteriovorax sp. Seq25_V]|uniref:pentapeptide repeat-containing protein n=1 Tax=Bacteriovorax sp. Seq25_V TaxID=1201288 RepID=UPI000389E5FE|nr:pentapeptide repeat-containing protein [Bacteriovorax sp. Seq25_V]EQC46836.1 pentapeptide repeat protein [Bacteriovorax sp. Seq25_V]
MTTLTQFLEPVFKAEIDKAQYEVIENEVIKARDLKELTVSGSLFSLTTFTGVTFESCVFFATRLENCIFIDCKFIDCKFEFSHIVNCNFNSVEFENCNWDFSTIKSNDFNHSKMCQKTNTLQLKGLNKLTNCLLPNLEMDWEEALYQEENKVSMEVQEKTQWGTSLLNFLKTA